MTNGQMESLHLIYVNVCNGLTYADNLLLEDIGKPARDSIRVIRDRLYWIKNAINIKVGVDLSKNFDLLRFDEVLRLMTTLNQKQQDELESIIVEYLKTLK
jgi:hypothetical protein